MSCYCLCYQAQQCLAFTQLLFTVSFGMLCISAGVRSNFRLQAKLAAAAARPFQQTPSAMAPKPKEAQASSAAAVAPAPVKLPDGRPMPAHIMVC
jgi:hypothetical protein